MIHSDLKANPNWKTPPIPFSFDQHFHYLGRGAQTFAFCSEDGNYVLKFYRHNRARHPLFFLRPFLPLPLKSRLIATHTKRQEKRLKDFSSYLIAYEKIKHASGLIDLHLNPTKDPLVVTLFDPIGVCHKVDLSQMQYLLQIRADPIYETVEKWLAEGEIEHAKLALGQLITLIANRCKAGLSDKDPDLKTNFGFTKDGPIQFDIGRFKLDPSKTENYRDELIRITDRLCKFLESKSPELVSHIRQEIERA